MSKTGHVVTRQGSYTLVPAPIAEPRGTVDLRTKIVLIAVGLLILAAGAFSLISPSKTASLRAAQLPNQVTLKASPISHIAQMFEHVGLGDEDVTAHFADGTPCTKLGGPTPVDFGDGMVLSFYKLDCAGVIGYVNVRWVND